MTEAIEALLAEARGAREQGRASASRDAFARAAALSRETGLPLLQAHALRHLSDIDREAGRTSEALGHAEQAASVYRSKGPPLDLANALRLKALALDDLRRPDQAAAVWAEARDLYANAGVAAGVAECEARLAPPNQG